MNRRNPGIGAKIADAIGHYRSVAREAREQADAIDTAWKNEDWDGLVDAGVITAADLRAYRAEGAKHTNPRRNAGDADWKVLDLHRMNGARKNAGQAAPGLYPISSLKKGEYFKRKPDARKVYVKGDYDRSERTYTGTDTEDISRAIYLKGTTRVYVGFDY